MALPAPDISLTIRRTVAAPRERVFHAWSDPAAMRQWLCPVGSTVTEAVAEARVGGRYRVVMQPDDGGAPSIAYGTYREVVPPERLVFTWHWEHQPVETLVTVELHDLGTETEVVLVHEQFPDTGARDRHNQGWASSLEHLALALPHLP